MNDQPDDIGDLDDENPLILIEDIARTNQWQIERRSTDELENGSFDLRITKTEIVPFLKNIIDNFKTARCFTARAENRAKDECQTCCIRYPTGIQVASQEGQAVFNLNGIQTQSGDCYNLINDLPHMQGLVDVVRLSPLGEETFRHLSRFCANEQGQNPQPLEHYQCNGYWHQLPGLAVEIA